MKLNKNIVLVGMMGSGKSSIGKILSKKLEFEFIDTDYKIEEIEKKTISEIFKKKGEIYFRNIEEIISLKSLKLNNKVIIPEIKIIDYKESIIFGFLGVLKMLNINNCYSSVTGSSIDHCSGDIFLP